ncbi:MAG: chemotaxis protein CheW [Pseudomonadota bacterium]
MTEPKQILNVSDEFDRTRERREFVTMLVDDQMFGIPVLDVQDVLGPQKLTWVPLASKEVAGVLNLRGRIVTAIDVRKRLGLPASKEKQSGMSIVVARGEELYSLVVDSVGEVLNLPPDAHERPPATLDPLWSEISSGVYRLDKTLLIVLDVSRLLDFATPKAA